MSDDGFQPHSSKQERVIVSKAPIILLACGIQFGKTRGGAVRTKLEMHTHTDPSDNFLIVAPTYKIMQQSTLPPFLEVMRGLGTYSKADQVFKMHGGGTCYLRTGTDPDSIVGITNIRFVWGDEAGLYSLYFWQNLQARAAFKKAQILLTTSPYSLNWVFKELIRPKQKDKAARPDCELIQARSDENPFFPRDVYERNRETMDERRFNMMFGGTWDRMEGLVYDCFDEVENIVKPFALPPGTAYYAGVDWGFQNPFAIAVRAVTPDGMHYQVAELYRTGMSPSQKVEAAKRLKLTFDIKTFFCDPAEPASISEFNANGIPATPADNDVKRGIDIHYELIKTRRYKVFEGTSPFTLDEYETYHWPEPKDLRSDQDEKDPNPVAQSNHICDANRYVSISLVKSVANQDRRNRRPFVPEERARQIDHHAETERLKRRPRIGGGSEDWSA